MLWAGWCHQHPLQCSRCCMRRWVLATAHSCFQPSELGPALCFLFQVSLQCPKYTTPSGVHFLRSWDPQSNSAFSICRITGNFGVELLFSWLISVQTEFYQCDFLCFSAFKRTADSCLLHVGELTSLCISLVCVLWELDKCPFLSRIKPLLFVLYWRENWAPL